MIKAILLLTESMPMRILYCENITGQEDFMVNIKNRDSLGVMDYPAPDWLRNAVIVELPVRGFN